MTESFAQLLREEEEQNKLRIQEELKLREENSHNNFLIMNWRNRNYTFRDRELDTDKNILRIIGIQRHKVNCPTCNGKGIINGEKCPDCKTNPHVSKGSGYTFLVNNQPCIHEWTFGYTNQSNRLSNAARICIHCGYNYDNYTD